MTHDWLFTKENNICNFRAAGVLLRGDKILLQRERDGTEYAVPGGHVQFGETAAQSLIREYKEETGADIYCQRLIWIEETFWKWGEKDAHTIAFYYLITLKNDLDIPDSYIESHKDNCNVMLMWVPVDEMKEMTVYPQFIKDKTGCISEGIEHFVAYDETYEEKGEANSN